MIDEFVRQRVFTWDDLNVRRKLLSIPKEHKIPELWVPKSDGKALSSRSLVLNGSGTMHYAVNR